MMFLLIFFFWDSYYLNVGAFNIVPEISQFALISFYSFFKIFSSLHHLFPPFYLPLRLFYLLPQLFYCWFHPEYFWSQLLHFSLLVDSCFFSSRSLLNFYCLFSILVSRLFICNSILFSRFWIILTIIILNPSGRLPISFSFVYIGGHLPCSFTCWVLLCLFILFRFLCLGWPFCMLEVCASSFLWSCSLWMELDEWLVKVPWLGKLVSVFWWVELNLFSLDKCPVVNSEVSMGLVWFLLPVF